jgi:hypothetical protein
MQSVGTHTHPPPVESRAEVAVLLCVFDSFRLAWNSWAQKTLF